jgi:hypothetical protein
MMEDFRNHDPKPNAQESALMAANAFVVMARLLALATLAVAIGLTASHGHESPARQTQGAVAHNP